MSEANEENFVKFLSVIGYPRSKVSWKWLIDHRPTEEIIKWICEDVNSLNYVSEEELNEYKILEDSGEVLEGEELENALSDQIPEYFELSDIDDDYMSALKDELQYTQNYSQSVATWVGKQQDAMLSAEREVTGLERTTANKQKDLVNAQSSCLGKSLSLESSMKNLRDNLVNVKKYCLDSGRDVSNARFLLDVSLGSYGEVTDGFSQELEMNLKQVISSVDVSKNCDTSSEETFDVRLMKAKKGLQNTFQVRTNEMVRRKGLESACECVKHILESKQLWEYSSNHQAIIKNLTLQKQNLQDLKAHGEHSRLIKGCEMEPGSKFMEVLTIYVNNKCVSLENLQHSLIFHQKQTLSDKLSQLVEVVKSQCATDLVWQFLTGGEVTEVLNLLELIKSTEAFWIAEQEYRLHRIERMKNLKERKSCEFSKAETWSLIYVLLSYLKTSQKMLSEVDHLTVSSILSSSDDVFHYLKLLVECNEKYKADNLKFEFMMKDMSDNKVSALMTSCKELTKLKGLICSGSTENYPVICTVKQLMCCYQSHTAFRKLKGRLGKLNTKLQVEKQETSVQENMERNLWKIFIINPEEVGRSIDSVNTSKKKNE